MSTVTLRGSAAIPQAQSTLPPTPLPELDAAVARARESKDHWAMTDVRERIRLCDEMAHATLETAPRWVASAVRAKGIPPGSPSEGEEWLGGPALVLRNLRLLAQALRDIERQGKPRIPGGVTTRPNGQVVAKVFPVSAYDRLLFGGFTAEIWMQKGVTPENLAETQALAYRDRAKKGKVALVLGAGNVSSIGPMDAFYKLFVENQVVVLKMNPVNEYLGPHFLDAFRPLVSRGFLQVVYGGAREGAHLARHPGIDEIHITGSDKTHDAIVFGPGEDGERRKAAHSPILEKRITSELGNVSPMIVVPGPWSPEDLDFQGMNLASSLANNAGFNCNATRVIVQDRGWPQREALLSAIRRAFALTPTRVAYYPGAKDRFRTFVEAHPAAELIGDREGDRLPWTLVSHLDPHRADDICFTTEAFCSVTSEVGLEAPSPAAFLDRAVEFCNERLWGSLNAALIVHPKSLKDPAVADAVERAVAGLRYGSVVVNHWPALSYALVSPAWGAYPGHDIYDIRSGMGVVHNVFMFDKVEKSVVRGPFRVRPKPPWFADHRTCRELGRKLAEFEADPRPWRMPGLIWSAMRG
jgi:acyl-CoA reductase-like NAD-dependent aldehyde dehydrogenase